jgi:hypothetical protein
MVRRIATMTPTNSNGAIDDPVTAWCINSIGVIRSRLTHG